MKEDMMKMGKKMGMDMDDMDDMDYGYVDGKIGNGLYDDPVNRGITGQNLHDKGMRYDPATGKDNKGMDYMPDDYM